MYLESIRYRQPACFGIDCWHVGVGGERACCMLYPTDVDKTKVVCIFYSSSTQLILTYMYRFSVFRHILDVFA